MWKITASLFVIISMIILVVSFDNQQDDISDVVSAEADFVSSPPVDINAFARAIDPYDWSFPENHGAHPDFQTEWWYYTGNLKTEDDRHFGFQFTVFRRAIDHNLVESSSEWRTNQLYMAHFTITDVEDERFYQSQRFSRGGAGLAGATSDPSYRVWLDDWQVLATDDDALFTTISASTSEVSFNLQLEQTKQPAFQGDAGLSQKGEEQGNASYYYSLTNLATTGKIMIGDNVYEVDGTTWMDHEFSTGALGENVQGWDWFGLHLDDDRELMVGQIRLIDGGLETVFGGLLVYPDGTTQYLPSDKFSINALDTWVSPHTGAEYPSMWEIVVDIGDSDPLQLNITPLLADQELLEGAIIYWEGAVQIAGDATGYGYAELTGYYGSMRGRF